MKCNVPKNSLGATKTIWDLCVLVTLRQYGWGDKRLAQFYSDLKVVEQEFTKNSCSTDVKRDSYSDIQTAVIMLLKKLKDVDWQEITGIEHFYIGATDLVKIANKVNGKGGE